MAYSSFFLQYSVAYNDLILFDGGDLNFHNVLGLTKRVELYHKQKSCLAIMSWPAEKKIVSLALSKKVKKCLWVLSYTLFNSKESHSKSKSINLPPL